MADPTARELTCQEFVELVTEYLEGTLSLTERLRFEAHLAECPYCLIYLEQMRQVIRTAGRLEAAQIAPPARQRLLAAFRGWQRDGDLAPTS